MKYKNRSPLNFSKALLFTAIYTAIMGALMYTSSSMGYVYGEPEMLKVGVFFMLFLVLYLIWIVWRYSRWSECGYGLPRNQYLWLLVPIFIVLGSGFVTIFTNVNLSDVTVEQWSLFALAGFTTLLIGFGEETMFRGILLQSARTRFGIYIAMLVSVVLFALVHVVNVFGGLSMDAMLSQLASSAVFAMALVAIGVKINNIFPLVVVHWLWDFMMFSKAIFGVDIFEANPYIIYFVFLQLALSVLAWWMVRRD